MPISSFVRISFFSFWLGMGVASAAENWWTHEVKGGLLPSDQGTGWKLLGDGSSRLSDDAIVIDTLGCDSGFWELNGGIGHAEWDGSAPTTLEFRMRVPAESLKTENGAEVVLSDGQKYYYAELNNPDYATFRIVLENGSAALYEDKRFVRNIEGTPLPDSQSTNQLRFGDTSGGIEAISEWQWIKWTNGAAVAPE